jgi:DNA-binding NarL/FixJ family response regulator
LLQTFSRVSTIKEASTGKELIKLVSKEQPDAVLLDLHMDDMNGEEVCVWLSRKYPNVKIIIISMEDAEAYVQHLISLGAHAYLSKNAPPEEVEEAIYAAVDHDFYNNDLVNRALLEYARKQGKSSLSTTSLSDRELEVVRLICDEFTMKEISEQLKISEKTVQNHRTSIMEKVGVRNTAGLVKYAVTKGLIK